MSKVNQSHMQELQDQYDTLDWDFHAQFVFADVAGEHEPCFVVMPGGAAIAINHHAGNGVDVARAKWIVDACNEKLQRMLDELELDRIP
jgi:hypothetical protein